MSAVLILLIIFGAIIVVTAIISGTIIMAIRLRHGGISKADKKHQTDEARMIQEIYQGLSRMEERVDTLETILMDKKK